MGICVGKAGLEGVRSGFGGYGFNVTNCLLRSGVRANEFSVNLKKKNKEEEEKGKWRRRKNID